MIHADLAFYLPPLTGGSGGHRTVLRYAAGMVERGRSVVCVIESGADVEREAAQLWPSDGVRFVTGFDEPVQAEVGYATAWHTAATVAHAPGLRHRAYLVQDIEGWFHPVGQHSVDAELSFDLGLESVALGRWLAGEVERRSGRPAHHIDFGVDLGTYRPVSERAVGPARVAVLVQPDKPRRMSGVVLDAVRALVRRRPSTEVLLFGSATDPGDGPWSWVGSLDESALAGLYAECTVGISISLTNPSRIPFEMMACGLPVVEVYRRTTLHDLPDDAVTLAVPGAESIAAAVASLLEDADRCNAASLAGLAFARSRPQSVELDGFEAAHEAICAGEGPTQAPPAVGDHPLPCIAPADEAWGPRYAARHGAAVRS